MEAHSDPVTRIPRRAFLMGAGATVVAAACGRGTDRLAATATPERPLAFVHAGAELAIGDERLAFGVFRNDQPLTFSRDLSGMVAVRSPAGRESKPVRLRTFPIVRSQGGESAREATERATLVAVARFEFNEPGRWDVVARLDINERRETAIGQIDVLPKSRTAGVGAEAIEVPTPTTDDARGVDPICTRNPVCSMHKVSLDQALRNGKPSVVVFATPALCESRMCGPDVDVVEKVRDRRADDANFIHVEIYKNQSGLKFAPATSAWSVDKAGEPWVFFISAEGTVRDRLSGPVAEWEVDDGVDLLVRS